VDGAGGEDATAGENVAAGAAEPGRDASRGPVLLPHLEALAALATRASELEDAAARYARMVEETFRAGGKLLLCGNGGSAATTEHVATEYRVRFQRERPPLPAIALSEGGAATTAAANDYSFRESYARQLRGLGRPGDLLVLHSTTGESENLVRAAGAAREKGMQTVALLADGGGRLAGAVDLALVVPTAETARAQELQMAIEHAVVDRVDAAFAADGEGDGNG
jgi:D-sedoheptulose 7-phosphate isomerase